MRSLYAPLTLYATLCSCGALTVRDTAYVIFNSTTGELGPTLQSWSYGNFSIRAVAPHGLPSSGRTAMSLLPDWGSGLYLHGSLVFLYGDLSELQMQAYNSGRAGAVVQLSLCPGDASSMVGVAVKSEPLAAEAWSALSFPFSAFNNGSITPGQQISCLKMTVPPHTNNDATTSAVLFADVVVVGRLRSEGTASARVGAKTARRVSPLLFGVNFGEAGTAFTANRWGGNAVTRYSWDLDVQNRAADWFFENIADQNSEPSKLPDNSSSDAFISATLAVPRRL